MRRWLQFVAKAVLALAVAASIYVGHSLFFGRKLGELCDAAPECSWAGLGHRVCLHTYWGHCTVPCRSNADCPPRWWCELSNPQGPVCRKKK